MFGWFVKVSESDESEGTALLSKPLHGPSEPAKSALIDVAARGMLCHFALSHVSHIPSS